MSVIEKYAPFNWGQFHVYIDGRDISLSPSGNERTIYLCVKTPAPDNPRRCDPSWKDKRRCEILNDRAGGTVETPRDYELALGAWYGRVIGADYLVVRAANNQSIDLS